MKKKEKFVDLFSGEPTPRMEAIMRRIKEAKAVGPDVIAEDIEDVEAPPMLMQEIDGMPENLDVPREIQSEGAKGGLRSKLENAMKAQLVPKTPTISEAADQAMELFKDQIYPNPEKGGEVLPSTIYIQDKYVGPLSKAEFDAMVREAEMKRLEMRKKKQ